MGETNFFILVLESSSDFLYGIHFILAKTLRLWVTGRLNSSSEFGYFVFLSSSEFGYFMFLSSSEFGYFMFLLSKFKMMCGISSVG